MNVDDLLSIDVAAEVRKLSRAQLESPAQLPVELVRRALAAGARAADVSCGRRNVTVRDDGPPLAAATIDALATLLDGGAPKTERHRALLALEAAGDLALIALAGLDAAQVRVRSGGRALLARRGAPPERRDAPGGGTTVEIAGGPLDAAGVRAAVIDACRFARVSVSVDRAPIPAGGFADVLAERWIDTPLPGRIALPAAGETARIWILLDGLIAAHVAVPGAPCFEAAVDARPLFPRNAPLPTASALRESVGPHAAAITASALDAMLEAARSIDSFPLERHGRIREWVLAAVRRGHRAEAMRAAPVFRALTAGGTEARWLSLDALDAAAGGTPRALLALFTGQDPRRFLLPATQAVPVLDAVERGRVSGLLGVSFRPPPPRRADARGWARARAAIASLRHGAGAALRRVRHPFGGRPVEASSLTAAERGLLASLREHTMNEDFEALDVQLVEGTGPVRRRGGSRPALLLPRGSPAVRAALLALARDPAWIYPVALALEAMPRPATRSLFWRDSNA